ncbi:MAG: HAD-IIA family hydrolase, partial [Promethearchaeota archaeon]
MRKLIDELKNIKLAIFDLDGVIYRGQKLIGNADKVIKELKEQSIKVIYNSNNSTISRDMYVEKLKRFNIPSTISDFYTSASITAAEITKIKEHTKIYIIGDVGLKKELELMGHEVISHPREYNLIDYVIVGLDIKFTYNKLAIAQKCILEGNAQFFATNSDATLPAENGLMPGAGVMVKSVEVCTGKKPVKIFGKPNPYGIQLILNDHGISPEQACIFGDRLETDILAGNRA